MIGLRHRHGIFCQEGSGARRAQLERLRDVARDNGPEELRSQLQNFKRDEVRELAQAAGLQTRYEDSNHSWMSVGDLRAALLEHVETEPAAAPEEFAAFALFCVSCFVLNFGNSMAILKGF